MPAARTTAAIVALCVIAACSSSGGDSDEADKPTEQRTSAGASSGSVEQSDNAEGPDEAQGDGADDDADGSDETDGADETGGTEGSEETDTEDTDAEDTDADSPDLDWSIRRLDAAGEAAATRTWTGAADTLGKRVTIRGPGRTLRFRAAQGRVQGLEMQWPWAVVYAGADLTRRGAKPGQVAVYDLRTGKRRMVGEVGSAPPPSAGGSISMHDGELAYPTGPNNRYCLARLDLKTLDGNRLTCAKPLKEGFTQLRLTPAALGFTSFTNSQRPCMTLKTIDGDNTSVVTAAKRCVGWEVVPGDESDVWLQIRNRNRIEIGTAYARDGDDVVKLGPAMSGSTTWCGGSTYYVRPAKRDGRADDLMRWSPETGLQRVWTPHGRTVSYVFAPRCGGSTITLPGLDRNQNGIVLSAPA